jgi:hypothetical protein
MNDRQLTQHERLADLFDEDCGSNGRLRSRRAAGPEWKHVRCLFLTSTRGRCISLRLPDQERPCRPYRPRGRTVPQGSVRARFTPSMNCAVSVYTGGVGYSLWRTLRLAEAYGLFHSSNYGEGGSQQGPRSFAREGPNAVPITAGKQPGSASDNSEVFWPKPRISEDFRARERYSRCYFGCK